MRVFVKFCYFFAAILALLAVLNFLVIPQVIVNVLKDRIEVEGSEMAGMKITVGNIKMNALFPFYIELQKVRAGGETLAFDVEMASLRLSPTYKNGQLIVAADVIVKDPQVNFRLFSDKSSSAAATSEKSTESVSTWNQEIFGIPVLIPVRLRLEGGQFKVFYDILNYFELKSFNLDFLSASALNREVPLDLRLDSQMRVQHGEYAFELPLMMNTKTLKASPESVQVNELKLALGGVESTIRGKTLLASMSHAWKLSLNVPALEKLPVPADFLPPGKWLGGIQGDIDFRQAAGGQPEVRTSFLTKNLTGDVELQQEDLSARGRLRALLSWQLNYINGEVSAPKVSVSVSSDDMAITKGKLFRKQPGQALNFEMDGYVTKNVLVLNGLKAALDRIRLEAAGFVGLVKGKRSDLTLRIPTTSLGGLEKMFPPMAQQPARGTLSLDARVIGDPFRGIEGLSVVAKPIRLRKFSTSLNFRDDQNKIKIVGPVRADLQAIVRSQGVRVGNTTVQGNVDLSQLDISYSDVFQKKAGSPLSLRVKVGNKGQSLSTSGSSLSVGKGVLSVSGTLSGFSDPRLKLQLGMKQLPVHQLLKMTGYYEDFPMNGDLGGKLNINGQWISAKGVEESPLAINGELSSAIRHLTVKTEEPVKSQDTPDVEVPKLKEVPPLAPSWELIKNMHVGIQGTIGELNYNDLKIAGVSYKARLQKGNLSATANIQKLFGGKVSVRSLKVPLLRSNPRVKVNASTNGVLIQSVLGWAMPEYAKEAMGPVNLQLDTSTELPSSVRFVSGMKGLISLNSPNLAVRSLKLNEVINESLKKIPKAKINPVKTEGFRGKVTMISAFADGAVKLSKLDIESAKKDQLFLKGQMDLEGGLNLRGSMSLAKPPMGGDIYLCNADKQGRFVVPVNVKGRWNQPSFSFASSTVETLVKKTLTCQARKEKKKLEQKLNKELEAAQKEVTKDIEKKAKDKLKDLFK